MDRNKKGHDFEREIARIFREHGFLSARRGMQYQEGGAQPDVVGTPGWHVECKRQEKTHLTDWMQQSVHDAKPGEIPVVVHKKSRQDILITMRFLQWIHREMLLNDALKYLKTLRVLENLDAHREQVNRILDFAIAVLEVGDDEEVQD